MQVTIYMLFSSEMQLSISHSHLGCCRSAHQEGLGSLYRPACRDVCICVSTSKKKCSDFKDYEGRWRKLEGETERGREGRGREEGTEKERTGEEGT